MIIGIDPGPEQSAYALVCDDYSVAAAAKVPNQDIFKVINNVYSAHVVIESIVSYGQPVGKDTFETCFWIGEFRREIKVNKQTYCLIPRQEYVNALCGCKGNDAILRQALLLRFGGDKKGEPLNALKGSTDLRSAFAVAAYWMDTQKWKVK